MRTKRLPRTAKDIFKLNFKDRILYNSAIIFYKMTGRWKYPVEASGDLETMNTFDKIYWLYKTINPIKEAYKASGLKEFFQKQLPFSFDLPAKFISQEELTISAVGDLMPHDYLVNSKATLYRDICTDLFSKDLVLANLECCISPGRKGGLEFGKKAGPALYYDSKTFNIIKGFQNHQYDFMVTACNHTLDLGMKGIEDTVYTLKKEGIAFNGINTDRENSLEATIIQKKGIRIGIICYTFGTNAHKSPPDKPYLLNKLNLNAATDDIDFSQIEQQINFSRAQEVDFIIAQLHWGYEHEAYPRPEQVQTAHHLAELGIDCIIGHHPHVVQPLEYYRTARDTDRVVPIYYSLGNLVNPFSAPYLTLSYLARIVLAKGIHKDKGSKTYIKEAGVSKIVQEANDENKTISLKKLS